MGKPILRLSLGVCQYLLINERKRQFFSVEHNDRALGGGLVSDVWGAFDGDRSVGIVGSAPTEAQGALWGDWGPVLRGLREENG